MSSRARWIKVKSSNIRRCCAVSCYNDSTMAVSLFQIPKDKELAKQWLRAAGREDLLFSISFRNLSYFKLCGDHFHDDMFKNILLKNRLIDDAVPTLFTLSSFDSDHTYHKVVVRDRHTKDLNNGPLQQMDVEMDPLADEQFTIISLPYPLSFDHSYCKIVSKKVLKP